MQILSSAHAQKKLVVVAGNQLLLAGQAGLTDWGNLNARVPGWIKAASTVRIEYEPTDTSGASIGCNAKDCRKIISVRTMVTE